MIENNRKLIKGTATYALGDFGTRILSFLIIPLYTYYISTDEMGIYDLLISTSGLLLPLITLQISDAAYRWMISKLSNPEDCISVAYKVLVITNTIFLFLLYIIRQTITIPYFELFSTLVILSSWYYTILKLIRGLGNQKLYALTGVIYTVIYLSLNFIQIVLLKRKIDSLFISAILGYGICIIFVLVKEPLLRKFKLQASRQLIRQFIIFSLPLIPNYLNWWVINSSDSYIVTLFLGASANGILAVSHKFPSLLQTIISLFNTSWQDLSVSKLEKDEQYNTKTFDLFSKVILVSLFVLIPATKVFICIIMNEQYRASSNYVPLYYLGAAFQGFSAFYGVGYIKKGKTSRAFITSIYAAVINLIVDLIAIRFIGIHAASLSTFIGFFIMWLVRERQNRKELGITVNWKIIIMLTIIDCSIAYISIISDVIVNSLLFVASSILFLIFFRSLLRTGVKAMKQKINNWRSGT